MLCAKAGVSPSAAVCGGRASIRGSEPEDETPAPNAALRRVLAPGASARQNLPMPGLTMLADENIPFAADAFGALGTVRLKHGRQIAASDLADVDVLVVRSITRVDRALLAGTRVRVVGTATSGSAHVAKDELEALGVAFHAALGCNANAVAEYMATARAPGA